MGEPLSASKWEPHREMTPRACHEQGSPPADDRVERPRVDSGQPLERSGAHGRGRLMPPGVGVAHVAAGRWRAITDKPCCCKERDECRLLAAACCLRRARQVVGGAPGVSERGGEPPGSIPNPVVPPASAGGVLGGRPPGKRGPRARRPPGPPRSCAPRPPPSPRHQGLRMWDQARSPRHALARGGAAAARWAHNPKVVGSNPTPATILFA
jgi:hypothetical protein